MNARPLVIACGALATELRAVLGGSGLDDVEVRYFRPTCTTAPSGSCPAFVTDRRREGGAGPCSSPTPTAGPAAPSTPFSPSTPASSRLPGAHCYEFFAGTERFAALHDAEPGTFYLTDFLAKHFDALVWQGLGLDRHPRAADTYFGNYRRVVLLSQATIPPCSPPPRPPPTASDSSSSTSTPGSTRSPPRSPSVRHRVMPCRASATKSS